MNPKKRSITVKVRSANNTNHAQCEGEKLTCTVSLEAAVLRMAQRKGLNPDNIVLNWCGKQGIWEVVEVTEVTEEAA
jgi:predicted acetyltransferase